jgi:hypothetical protein
MPTIANPIAQTDEGGGFNRLGQMTPKDECRNSIRQEIVTTAPSILAAAALLNAAGPTEVSL